MNVQYEEKTEWPVVKKIGETISKLSQPYCIVVISTELDRWSNVEFSTPLLCSHNVAVNGNINLNL